MSIVHSKPFGTPRTFVYIFVSEAWRKSPSGNSTDSVTGWESSVSGYRQITLNWQKLTWWVKSGNVERNFNERSTNYNNCQWRMRLAQIAVFPWSCWWRGEGRGRGDEKLECPDLATVHHLSDRFCESPARYLESSGPPPPSPPGEMKSNVIHKWHSLWKSKTIDLDRVFSYLTLSFGPKR